MSKTKTTECWLARDPDGSYMLFQNEPQREWSIHRDVWWFMPRGGWYEDAGNFVIALRKGRKRPVRVTVEVLR